MHSFIAVFLVALLPAPILASAETPAEAVIGTWRSRRGEERPLVFHKDGKFEYGFDKRDGRWRMAKGTYTISAKGKIDATADIDGIRLGLHFTLEQDVIRKPGPPPRVEWRKEKR